MNSTEKLPTTKEPAGSLALDPRSASVTVTPCREISGMNKCPRCLRWTKNDGPTHLCADGTEGVICWRCQLVLVEDHPAHEVTKKVMLWRESQGLLNNRGQTMARETPTQGVLANKNQCLNGLAPVHC